MTRTNPGSISTFILVGKGQYEIAVGYGTDAFGDTQFFLDSNLPESTYHRQWLGATGVTGRDNNAYYAKAYIISHPETGVCSAGTLDWFGLIAYHDVDYVVADAGCSAFAPDNLAYGSYLVGNSGGSANIAFFEDNQYSITPGPEDQVNQITADFHYLTSDGAVSANGPPYVAWSTLASKNPRWRDLLCRVLHPALSG